jgi:hypothetical protein
MKAAVCTWIVDELRSELDWIRHVVPQEHVVHTISPASAMQSQAEGLGWTQLLHALATLEPYGLTDGIQL